MVNVCINIFMLNEDNFITIIAFVTANDHMIVTGIYNYLIHYPFHNLFIIVRTSTHCCTWLPIKQAPYSGAMLCEKS